MKYNISLKEIQGLSKDSICMTFIIDIDLKKHYYIYKLVLQNQKPIKQ